MATYIVTFEVDDPTRRKKIEEKLKEFSAYCPIHEYAWAIKTDKKASEIRDAITPVMISGDRIFVIRSGTEAAWRNAYGTKHSEWLKKHL